MIILSSRLLKQFKSKIKACPINAGLNIAFNAFHTLHFIRYLLNPYLAALDAIYSESYQRLFPNFFALPCGIWAYALFSDRSSIYAALHRIQFRTYCFVPMPIFTQRPGLNEAKSAALFSNKSSPIPSKISFHMKNRSVVTTQNLHTIQTFLTVELS